jgi:hypothetical protein
MTCNEKKSEIKLFKLSYPEGNKDLYLGVDDDLSPDDLKIKFPQLHDYQFERLPNYRPARMQEQ